MKTLVICRHAKSDWPAGVPDIERPLKSRGENDAKYLGNMLGQQGFSPDLVISSPANRARSTAKIICDRLGYKDEIQIERAVYYGGRYELIDLIRQLPDHADKVMIFGHNPTFEDTVRDLLQIGAPFAMPTCAMACIESFSFSWQQLEVRNMSLRWYLVPRLNRSDD